MKESGLGTYVSNRRKALGLTQNDLAQSLGYTSQGISKFESGESQISILVLPKLANLLQESLDDLLNEAKEPAPLKEANPVLNEAILSANLVALRLEKNLSQTKEAEILHVSKRSIINYEQGESYPSIETLLLLLQTYSISAKSFFYEKRSIPNNQPVFVDQKKKKKKILIVSLISLAAILTVVGATSPLWSASFQAAKTSSSNPASSLITSSNAASSSSSEASSSLSSSEGDLSPYLPGLKKLFVQTTDGIVGTKAIPFKAGTYGITFFSGAFKFSEANKDTYAFAFGLNNAPSEVILTPSTSVYDEASLLIPSTVPLNTTFQVTISAWATAHPDDKVWGTPLTITVSDS